MNALAMFGLKPTENKMLEAALAEGEIAEKSKAALYEKIAKLQEELLAKNRDLGAAAFEAETLGNTERHERIKAEIARVEGHIARVNQALVAADEKIHEALDRVTAAKNAAKAREGRRLINKRQRAFRDLQGAQATIAYAFPEIHECNEALRRLFEPASLPDGTLTTDPEIGDAMQHELLRLAKPDPIVGPWFPGVPRKTLESSATVKPLLELLEHADNFILQQLDAPPVKSYGPGAVAERDAATLTDDELLAGLRDAIAPDADDALLLINPNSTEFQTLEPLRSITIDHRKGAQND